MMLVPGPFYFVNEPGPKPLWQFRSMNFETPLTRGVDYLHRFHHPDFIVQVDDSHAGRRLDLWWKRFDHSCGTWPGHHSELVKVFT